MENIEKQNNTNIVLSNLENSKQMTDAIIQSFNVIDDNKEIVDNYVKFARVKDAIDKALKDKNVKNKSTEAFLNIPKTLEDKTLVINKAKIKYAPTYTKYDFSDCGHPLLDYILFIEKHVKNIRKQIENELKTIPEAKPTVDENGKVKMIGGKKNIIISHSDIYNIVSKIIEEGQILIDTFDEENNIITVNKAEKQQTMGLKISNK